MTVASDLAKQTGAHRRLFLKIDGLEPILWQRSLHGLATSEDVGTGIVCLHAPSEHTVSIDLQEGSLQQSAMTFTLDNIKDPSATDTYYFASLFAPGKWALSTEAHTYLSRPSGATDRQIDADATSIMVADGAGFADSGIAYIGNEAFSYSGKSASGDWTEFTGVVKGLYPAVGDEAVWGKTYRYPDTESYDDKDMGITSIVSSVRYSWIGARVGLYVTTWDETAGAWHSTANAKLLWCGHVSDSITYSASEDVWQLSCESIVEAFDRPIVASEPATELFGINLEGPKGLTFRAQQWSATAFASSRTLLATATITLAAKWHHTINDLADAFRLAFNDSANWTGSPIITCAGYAAEPVTNRVGNLLHGRDITFQATPDSGDNGPLLILFPDDGRGDSTQLFTILGLTDRSEQISIHLNTKAGGIWFTNYPVQPGATVYHPYDLDYNGKKMHVLANAENIFPNGTYFVDVLDEDTSAMYRSGDVHVPYSAVAAVAASGADPAHAAFTVVATSDGFPARSHPSMRRDGEPVRVVGKYYIHDTGKGPFASLLFPLLSTGTTDYNGNTYDKLPYQRSSTAIQDDLIDTASFADADKVVLALSPELCKREYYQIDVGVTWLELWKREAALFGASLAWRDGKIRCVLPWNLEFSRATVTLGDDTNADPYERTDVVTSTEHVLNSYSLKLGPENDRFEGTFIDEASYSALGVMKDLEIEHPGVRKSQLNQTDLAQFLGEGLFLSRSNLHRFPWQKVSVTLAPLLAYRVWAGDFVRYISTVHPDPFGSGSMTTSTYGIVVDCSWDYETWTGEATVLLHTAYDLDLTKPWAGSALIDVTKNDASYSGGWDSADYLLYLVPYQYGDDSVDPKDGFVFESGDVVTVYTRCNFTPAQYSATDATVAQTFELHGDNVLTLEAVSLAVDETKEWIIVPASYDKAVTAQHADNAYLADSKAKLGESNETPDRYG